MADILDGTYLGEDDVRADDKALVPETADDKEVRFLVDI
jgi:hypothetical protein